MFCLTCTRKGKGDCCMKTDVSCWGLFEADCFFGSLAKMGYLDAGFKHEGDKVFVKWGGLRG